MRWTKYTLQTTTKDADLVSAVLMDFGICDIQIENNVQLTEEELNRMYADFVKELPPDDGSCSFSFYLEADDGKGPEIERDLKRSLEEAVSLYGMEPVALVCEAVDSEDWENNWKEFFKPFTVGRILIAPTWEEIPEDLSAVLPACKIRNFVPPEEAESSQAAGRVKKAECDGRADVIVRIDPGMAFGTGAHETTRLCLRALQKYMKAGDQVLDLGCGSGILGIAAMKLGAERVVSADIDEQAVRVAEENFNLNGVSEECRRFFTGNIVKNPKLQQEICSAGAKSGGYDIVTVNILADVINALMPGLHRYLRTGGVLITSGILKEKEQLIRDAIAANPNLELLDVRHDGDWTGIAAVRKQANIPETQRMGPEKLPAVRSGRISAAISHAGKPLK